MTKLIIESVPSGAEVTFDGKVIGTTPLAYTIDEAAGLAEFRAECLSNENVVCSWGVLKTRLEDLTVSRLWWDLTRDERYAIAEMAVKNVLFYYVKYGRGGKADCAGGEGEYIMIVCVQNAIIRCMKFGSTIEVTDMMTGNNDACYFKRSSSDVNETCYKQAQYNLPCHNISCHEHFGGVGFSHAMCGIQIVEGYDSLDNWAVFQYNEFDIKPGDDQMPYNKKLKFHRLITTQCNGGMDAEYITEFDI